MKSNIAATRGFSMLEVVAVMAMMALVVSLITPGLRGGTGKSDLQALALEVTAMLRSTRLSAIERGKEEVFFLDMRSMAVLSSARPGISIVFPRDVDVTHEVSSRCRQSALGIEVIFLPDGRTCGSQITLRVGGFRAVIQTNWLVGKTSLRFETS